MDMVQTHRYIAEYLLWYIWPVELVCIRATVRQGGQMRADSPMTPVPIPGGSEGKTTTLSMDDNAKIPTLRYGKPIDKSR